MSRNVFRNEHLFSVADEIFIIPKRVSLSQVRRLNTTVAIYRYFPVKRCRLIIAYTLDFKKVTTFSRFKKNYDQIQKIASSCAAFIRLSALDNGTNFNIHWSIVKHAKAYKGSTRRCNLCLTLCEKGKIARKKFQRLKREIFQFAIF